MAIRKHKKHGRTTSQKELYNGHWQVEQTRVKQVKNSTKFLGELCLSHLPRPKETNFFEISNNAWVSHCPLSETGVRKLLSPERGIFLNICFRFSQRGK